MRRDLDSPAQLDALSLPMLRTFNEVSGVPPDSR